ncbi:GNAT family N-acetyltransferase [Umezawaea sp. NPDC059074]|uniref:GNAT family N-acetyltransferase n=1 Tax=Umezawaea sp. NPDC059074 TaxID=3346716 RepID=UPI0036B9A5EE
MTSPAFLQPEPITTDRLGLEPLRVEHAEEMVGVLGDVGLYGFIGGGPPSVEVLRERYRRQVAGVAQGWLNWVARCQGRVVGTVQATVVGETADVAWVVGTGFQGRGYAGEAALGMVEWLWRNGIREVAAYVHPEHHASAAVAKRVGLVRTGVVVDGEVRWVSAGR